MRRPVGVVATTALFWVVGGVGLVFVADGLVGGLARGPIAVILDEAPTSVVLFARHNVVLRAVAGGAAILAAWGCWQLRPWARILAVVLAGLNAVGAAGMWIWYQVTQSFAWRFPVSLGISCAVVIYLSSRPVRRVFAPPGSA